jgi:hypothetical protein
MPQNYTPLDKLLGHLMMASDAFTCARGTSNPWRYDSLHAKGVEYLLAAVRLVVHPMPHPWDLTLYHFTMTSDKAPKANGNITTSITFRDDTDYAGVPYYSGIHNE